MKRTLIKKLYFNDVRELCINNNYYTNGDNKSYNNLCDYIVSKTTITDNNLLHIAEDIKKHSITSDDLSYILTQLNKKIIILESEEV